MLIYIAAYSCVWHNNFIEQNYVLYNLLQKFRGPIWTNFAMKKAEVGKDFMEL